MMSTNDPIKIIATAKHHGRSEAAALVMANRILVNEGVLDCYGHVSVRHARRPDRYWLSRSLAPELVTVADIMEYDLDSEPVNGRGHAMYQERFLHGEIYKARPDVNTIVHSHSPSLITFGVTDVPLRCVYHMSAFIAAGVPVFDIGQFDETGNSLVCTEALGKALSRVLGDKPAVLMRGHGSVVVGEDVPAVVGRSIYLEINAKLQMQAIALGGQVVYLDSEAANLGLRLRYRRAWELWQRKIANRADVGGET